MFNALYGSTIDELVLVSLNPYIKTQCIDSVEELPNHFMCNVVRINGNVEILCKENIKDDIDVWLSQQTSQPMVKSGKPKLKYGSEKQRKDPPSIPPKPKTSAKPESQSVSVRPKETGRNDTNMPDSYSPHSLAAAIPHSPVLGPRQNQPLPPIPDQNNPTSTGATPNSHMSKSVHGRGFLVNQKCHVYIQVNDITKLHSDVIINPTNNSLSSKEGVSEAIVDVGGPILTVDSYSYVERHGYISCGQTVQTLAGNLPCAHVLHAVLPHVPGEFTTHKVLSKCEQKLKTMFRRILKKLDKVGIKTVTMPPMAEGTCIYTTSNTF